MKATLLKKAALTAGSLSLLAGAAFSQSAVSNAGGYETITINGSGAFTVFGLRLHEPIVVSGTFESQTGGTTLTDTDVDFDTALAGFTSGTDTLLIEITGATASEGTVIEFNTWSVNDITGLSGIVADDVTDYSIRAAKTIADVFGADNDIGLTSSTTGAPSGAAILYVPNASGGFDQFYHLDFTGQPKQWLQVGAGNADNFPLNYVDGLIISEPGATDLSLVVTGMVKTSATRLPVSNSFTYLGTAYPVGSELLTSNLGESLTASTTGAPSSADIVYMPLPDASGYRQFYYLDFTGQPKQWLEVGAGNADTEPLTSGIIVNQQGTGGAYNGDIIAPAFYANL